MHLTGEYLEARRRARFAPRAVPVPTFGEDAVLHVRPLDALGWARYHPAAEAAKGGAPEAVMRAMAALVVECACDEHGAPLYDRSPAGMAAVLELEAGDVMALGDACAKAQREEGAGAGE